MAGTKARKVSVTSTVPEMTEEAAVSADRETTEKAAETMATAATAKAAGAADPETTAKAAPKSPKSLRRAMTAEEFEELCSLQATVEELCGWWGVTPKYLNAWCRRNYRAPFDTVRGWCVQDGRIRLRRLQAALAAKSVQMALALAKVMLPPPEAPDEDGPLQEFLRMTAPDPEAMKTLFGGENDGEAF